MLSIKKILFCGFVLLSTSTVFAEELKDGCEPAVDAADRLQADADKHCDYSNTGLNGVLHRALNKKENLPMAAEPLVQKTAANAVALDAPTPRFKLSAEFNSAQQLVNQRYELLQKAAHECSKGFAVNSEHYLPVSAKSMTIELSYQCL